MTKYTCKDCNFKTNLKANFVRHNSTNKHCKNVEKCGNNSSGSTLVASGSTLVASGSTFGSTLVASGSNLVASGSTFGSTLVASGSTLVASGSTLVASGSTSENINNYFSCQVCNKILKHKSSYYRHLKTCKKIIKLENNNNTNTNTNTNTDNNTNEITNTSIIDTSILNNNIDNNDNNDNDNDDNDNDDNDDNELLFNSKQELIEYVKHELKYQPIKTNNNKDIDNEKIDNNIITDNNSHNNDNNSNSKNNVNSKNTMNTVNNSVVNNNITIRNFGAEDTSHLSDEFMYSMIRAPYKMMLPMIEKIHLDKNKPENKNIKIPNIRDNKVKIYDTNRWNYRDKEEVLKDMIDAKCYEVDRFYTEKNENNREELEKNVKKNQELLYKNFQKKYDNNESGLLSYLFKDCNLALLTLKDELNN